MEKQVNEETLFGEVVTTIVKKPKRRKVVRINLAVKQIDELKQSLLSKGFSTLLDLMVGRGMLSVSDRQLLMAWTVRNQSLSELGRDFYPNESRQSINRRWHQAQKNFFDHLDELTNLWHELRSLVIDANQKCLDWQGKYQELQKLLFANQNPLLEPRLIALMIPIDERNCSYRVRSLAKRLQYTHLSQFLQNTVGELMFYRNVGEVTVAEINQGLQSIGQSLRK